MNRIRLALRRMFRRPNPTGPMRFYTRPTAGVFLDLEEYFEHVVTTIADDGDALPCSWKSSTTGRPLVPATRGSRRGC
jgi:hypothetical protein